MFRLNLCGRLPLQKRIMKSNTLFATIICSVVSILHLSVPKNAREEKKYQDEQNRVQLNGHHKGMNFCFLGPPERRAMGSIPRPKIAQQRLALFLNTWRAVFDSSSRLQEHILCSVCSQRNINFTLFTLTSVSLCCAHGGHHPFISPVPVHILDCSRNTQSPWDHLLHPMPRMSWAVDNTCGLPCSTWEPHSTR